MIAATVERVRIDKIEVGIRRRQKIGNIRSLAKSIEARGLLHPILVRNGKELVAGQRRLEACRLLGWPTIPARDVTGCDDDELRAIELEENTERLDLLDYEASKARLAEIKKAQEAAETQEESSQVSRGARGPSRQAGSRKDVEAKTGIAPSAQREIEKHVDLAEQYAVFQGKGWRQSNVLAAGEALAELPEKERSSAIALIDQEAIPPKTAIAMIENLGAMKPAERREVFQLAASDDPHDVSIATTRAAAVPPPVDPGLMLLIDAEETLRRAAKACRTETFKVPLRAIAESATELLRSYKAHVEAHR